MRKQFIKFENIILALLCMGVTFGCAPAQQTEDTMTEQEEAQSSLAESEPELERERRKWYYE